ncbi:MAG TPA: efflux RND transporter periplasmic adaptor subunit [Crenalkalicoccus sp.]|nr:efflux RND transporter periplasmic adaptor subunit [Crenalkalicoccus sp.]
MLALLSVLPLLLAGCDDRSHATASAPPPPAVTVLAVHSQQVPITTELPGRTSAYRVAEVRPQVSGVILSRMFTEGHDVKVGEQLYQIDPAPYQAALDSAQAAVAKARATAVQAQITVDRYAPLVRARAVSQQDYDSAVASLRQAQADVESGKAQVQTARINLDYTRLSSSIEGRTGRSSVTAGALVTADQTSSLVTVTQLDPIYVDLTQPSSTLLRLRRELADGTLHRLGANQAELHLVLDDGARYDRPGRLEFSEVSVDQTTGTVVLRALFPNPDGVLLPGMFVRAELDEGIANAMLMPQQGVTHDQRGGATALVVKPDGTVELRAIRADRAVGNKWLVTAGLQDGDRVIVEGVQRARPGSRVAAAEVTLEQFERQSSGTAQAAQQQAGG